MTFVTPKNIQLETSHTKAAVLTCGPVTRFRHEIQTTLLNSTVHYYKMDLVFLTQTMKKFIIATDFAFYFPYVTERK